MLRGERCENGKKKKKSFYSVMEGQTVRGDERKMKSPRESRGGEKIVK